ncbi:hypothetical protein AAFF_G00013440 [Aldrovandia affinis]|uniref:Uncharacterized protein n=1 Tax=Aldrovandia affinis TaxID=143900 RepID=A0AAD7S669_9TELE|nr:hypothetical protein AAFF_G00013440 [Aldrovandia affinis]
MRAGEGLGKVLGAEVDLLVLVQMGDCVRIGYTCVAAALTATLTVFRWLPQCEPVTWGSGGFAIVLPERLPLAGLSIRLIPNGQAEMTLQSGHLL